MMKRNTELSLQKTVARRIINAHDRIENQLPAIKAMSQLTNSGITVYDLKQRVHVYSSINFFKVFGFDEVKEGPVSNEVFDKRVHPADLLKLANVGYLAMKYIQKLPVFARKDYKMITEYRIRNARGLYIQVTEKHHILELDADGNVSFSLGVMDVSPNQTFGRDVQFQLVNCSTGEFVDLSPKEAEEVKGLTAREREILEMVRRGNLSKEISDMLSISIHTVNTHRQRILEKLNAGNAMEAVLSAKSKGILT